MNFSIDVVYLDAKQCVVHIEERLKPWRLGQVKMQAKSVIELPDETVKTSGTVIGDEIEIVLGQVGEASRE